MKDCYELANGVKIPCMGYGTYKAAEGNNESIIKTAIEAGYRYFDIPSSVFHLDMLTFYCQIGGIIILTPD